jgi:methionine synthase II (cobalamin-independent)
LYDGLKSEIIPVPVIEWYYAYHYVSIKTGSMLVDPNNNTITIEFEVLKNETVYDTRTYSHDVKVYQIDRHATQTLIDHREINNTLYTFSLEHKEITQAVTNFEIHITETGCPTIIHPFIIRFNISGGDDDKNKTVTATVEATKHKSASDSQEEEGDDLEMTNDYDKVLSNMAN